MAGLHTSFCSAPNSNGKHWQLHPVFRHRTGSGPLWMPLKVNGRLATPTQLNFGPEDLHLCYSVTSGTSQTVTNTELQILCENGQAGEALEVLSIMDQQGTAPLVEVYRSLLQACTKRRNLAEAKRLYLHLIKEKLESSKFLGQFVVAMLVKCGDLKDALEVFHKLPHRTSFTWTHIILGYTEAGHGREALRMYQEMREGGVHPDRYTFVSLLKACGSIPDLEEGKRIHAEAVKYRCVADLFVGTCLVDMYAKCGSIEDAQQVFEMLPKRDLVSWNAMLAGYSQLDQGDKVLRLFKQMQDEGVGPDERTFLSLLQACGSLADEEESVLVAGDLIKLEALWKGKAVHAESWTMGYKTNLFIGSTLVSTYGKCGSCTDAQYVFERMSRQDVVSWTALLSAYVQQGQGDKVLQLYEQMRMENVSPDLRAFITLVQACGTLAEKGNELEINGHLLKLEALQRAKEIHAEALRRAYAYDEFVGSSLVSMYGKCWSNVDAHLVFEGLQQQSIVSWNAILAACSQQGQSEDALQIYGLMHEEGVAPNDRSFSSVLQACGDFAEKEDDVLSDGQLVKLEALQKGKAIHAEAWDRGYMRDVFVGSALIRMYGKCGSIVDAQDVFDVLPERDVVVWNAMLVAHVEQGQGKNALQLYGQMQEEGVRASENTLVCILQASGNIGSIEVCMWIHQTLVSTGSDMGVAVANTLIDTYSKCGSMKEAEVVFAGVSKPDVVSWNVLIGAYARHGNFQASLQRFQEMQVAGTKPDRVTFLSLLSACSHGGLIDKGLEYFKSMTKDHCITPDIEHYVCMVDLLGRAGHFNLVEDLLSQMPVQPNLPLWLCLLSACRKHSNVVLGKHAFDSAVRLQPEQSAAYVLMSNTYFQAGMLECAQAVYELKQVEGKEQGKSWMEYDNEVHTFVVKDCSHQFHEHVFDLLQKIVTELQYKADAMPPYDAIPPYDV